MLVAFPVAFYTAAMVCFIVYSRNAEPFWFKVALAANIAGVAMAVLAALPGFIDWLNIPSGIQAKRTGIIHLAFNVTALLLFAVNAFMLYDQWNATSPELGLAVPLTIVGFTSTIIAGFMGWTMVQKHHVGVDRLDEEIRSEKEERMSSPELGQQPMWKAAGDTSTREDRKRDD
jgi:uncharacterized membrane protein